MHEPATRRTAPLVYVTDGKEHIRRFLRETLSEFRFVIQECVEAAELSAALDARAPDLVVLGLTAGASEARDMPRRYCACAIQPGGSFPRLISRPTTTPSQVPSPTP